MRNWTKENKQRKCKSSTFTLTRSQFKWNEMFDANFVEANKKKDETIFQFEYLMRKRALFSRSICLSHPFFNCNVILRAAFLLVQQLLCWPIFYCFFFRLSSFLFGGVCVRVYDCTMLFNLRISTKSFSIFYLPPLNMATSAKSYYKKANIPLTVLKDY